MPPLVGQIVAGILLGPKLTNFAPNHEGLMMLGEIGLIFNMFDAGIELDVALLRTSGSLPIVMSLLGAALTMGAGMGVGIAYGFDFQASFAIGATFVQTANATCFPVLTSGGILRTYVGQVIIAATIIDDMIALIMLSVMDSFGSDEKIPVFQFFVPCLTSIGWIVFLGMIAITIAPRLIDTFLLPRISREANKHFALFLMMSAVFAAYLPLLHYTRSSYLIGAFLCGTTFSQVETAHSLYVEKGGQIVDWGFKLFFSASIGFQVPIKYFGTVHVWTLGLILVFTAVAIKSAVGLCVPRYQEFEKGAIYNPHRRDRLVAGISMMSRGGFGFLISGYALNNGIFGVETYASVVLAVLIGTIFPAYLLNVVIGHFKKLELKSKETSRTKIDKPEQEKLSLFIHVHLETKGAWGLMEVIRDDLNDIGLKVKESKTRRRKGINPVIISDLYLRDSTMEVFTKSAEMRYINQMNVPHGESTESQDALRVKLQELANSEIMKDNRFQEILSLLEKKIGQFKPTKIDITQWDPYSVEDMLESLVLTRADGKEPSLEFFSNLFTIIDTNGDGLLDVEELRRGLKKANSTLKMRDV
mmetsp:Transcript_22326/g.32623  ORF Transcript_22326/g.32623 Transcript_22326/m.32623 type:complete len:587 (-) Transcript_22326:95-1855(-)|eukprot:CAMPEP_0195510066 /NCGR_PEP_ID=MMETSP0794_2-20130614/2818_1 /TAXON_ID=515487 /ORGANISM="Stephanopyxis turris, Strain CCMP 815" /LENGTH=586 /DNA_ID=CAMNT_0040637419 /DNA_START=280 /DNA_END=2040 /DNA_ORIENTATION=-